MKLAYRQVVGARRYELLEFRRHLGYWPKLDRPRTFNEKICARKFQALPEAVMLADKLAVREFVERRAGQQFLTRLHYAGTAPEAVDYEALPCRFVLKSNHGSGSDACLLVLNKASFSRDTFVVSALRMLRRKFGPEVNELWYPQISPKIMIEEMVVEKDGSLPPDFKFYVFGGEVRYVQVITGRYTRPKSRFYDPSWRAQPFHRSGFTGLADVARPPNLADMIGLAERLADGLEFVRVDLYSVGQRVIFGEMTFAPGAGWIRFVPPEYDLVLGQHWGGPAERRSSQIAKKAGKHDDGLRR